MRNLASVRRIREVNSIPNADSIETAIVDGWECVVRKSEGFKPNDLVVYIEVDSIVPERPEFEFLRDRKFRVRTIKLRKQISQGLVLPLTILPEKDWKEGDDVTNILGVKKYDPELEEENRVFEERKRKFKNPVIKYFMRYNWFRKLILGKPKPKSFPDWVVKTDETRIQNLVHMFETEKAAGTLFEGREKVDGQSATYTLKRSKRNKYEFVVCSRNLRIDKPDNSNYWKIAEKYNIKAVLKDIIGDNNFVTLQGEIYGEGIQGNKYKLDGIDIKAFNLIYPNRRVPTKEFEPILAKYGISTVPLVVSDYKLPNTIHEIVEFSKGKSKLLDRKREGIVFRNYDKDISFKVINPDFLLEEK